MKKSKPIAIDVFSGCGGLTTGLKAAGFRVLGAIEYDALAAETYKKNHRSVTLWESDVRELEAPAILKKLSIKSGDLDLLAGCPPCQAFSSMRTRNGGRRIRDDDKDLLFEFLRLVLGFAPKVVMMENVPGLAKDRRLRQFSATLTANGYDCRWSIENCADFGVPQRRRRLVFIASRIGRVNSLKVTSTASPSTVRKAIGALPKPGGALDPLHQVSERRSKRIAAMIAKIPRDGGSRSALGKGAQLRCHKKTDGFKDVYGRMAWDAVSPTITGGCVNPSKGRFLHPSQNRSITLREAALLQSFPKKYRFSLRRGKFAAAVMIGNALPPLFVKHHAMALRKHLRVH